MFGEYFKNKVPIFEKLIPFGFNKQADAFTYSTPILDGQFLLEISITPNGELSTKLTDTFTQELYTLHLVEDAQGAYVGEIRQAIGDILEKIAKDCFRSQVFNGEIAQKLIAYTKEKYDAPLEFLWEKFDDNAIWRRQDNKKWFGLLVKIQKRKLGLQEDGNVEILIARINSDNVLSTIDGKRYLPAYHMNKKNWITVMLDGSVSCDEVFRRLDDSFSLAKKK